MELLPDVRQQGLLQKVLSLALLGADSDCPEQVAGRNRQTNAQSLPQSPSVRSTRVPAKTDKRRSNRKPVSYSATVWVGVRAGGGNKVAFEKEMDLAAS